MSPGRQNRAVQAELDRLLALGLLSPEQRARVGERYPTGPVDLGAMARWLTLLGAATAAVGGVLLLGRLLQEWLSAHVWLVVEGGLLLLSAALLTGGVALTRRGRLRSTGAALELLGSMAVEGLIVALAIHHSTGSRNWPALVGVLTVAAAALAYALRNRLVLILAAVEAFLWFGGSTGYASGWGAWWLGMTYPARFAAAGLVLLGVGWLHAREAPPPWQGFARVYAHVGMLDLHLALWFLSVFGYFEEADWWRGTTGERLLFSALWAAVSLGCVWAAGRVGLRLLRGYGLTFLLVNVYTFYFQFIAWNSPGAWFVHLLAIGGALVGGGIFLERAMRERPGPGEEPLPPPPGPPAS